MLSKEDNITFEESKKQWKALIDRICRDDDFSYYFFYEKCRPLFSKILWKLYGNNADYDELVNDLYLVLRQPDANGEMWHALKTYDYRTNLFDWIKTVAVRHFYTPSNETFLLPEILVGTNIVEEMFSQLRKSVYRKYMCYKYIDLLDDDLIASKLDIERSQLAPLSRKAIKQLKSIVSSQFPEYYSILFKKVDLITEDLELHRDSLAAPDIHGKQEAKIDVYQYLSAMPNAYYRKVIKALFLDEISPEDLAVDIGTSVANVYNIKSRGLDQLRDVVLFSDDIRNLKKYINLVSCDRNRRVLISLFIEKKDYDVVCSELEVTETEFKKIKKDAIKEIKQIIFKAKS
jgi:RNA polymerase sigma factor (sigma-70 family)